MKHFTITTSEVIQRLEAVSVAPVQVLIPDGEWVGVSHKAIVGQNTHKVYAIHTKHYGLVSHREIVERVVDALDYGKFSYDITRLEMLKGGGRMNLHLRFPETYPIRPGDDVNLELVLSNSYDGGSALSLVYGAFRLICSNGMVIGEVVKRLRRIHTTKLNRETLITDFTAYITGWKEDVLPMIKGFTEMGITKQEGLELIQTLCIADKWRKEIASKWAMDGWIMDTASGQNMRERTAWVLLNVITYITSHHADMRYGVGRHIQDQALTALTSRGGGK